MYYKISILLEIPLIAIHFTALWLIFYKLSYQESKFKRFMLIFLMLVYRPVCIIVNPFFYFSLNIVIITMIYAVFYSLLVVLAGGKTRYKAIMAVYHWGVTSFLDIIISCFYVGIKGSHPDSYRDLYLVLFIFAVAVALLAVFYYWVMRAVPQEALNRVPLHYWLVVLLTPFCGSIAFFIAVSPLDVLIEAGVNNYLNFSLSATILLMLSFSIFYCYIKLITGYNARLLADELNKAPPVYTPQNGLSSEFVEKYGLSKRQAEIAEALLLGKANKEIALLMNIEVNTVQVHLQNVYRKTGAPGRYALMALVGLGK